MLPALGLSRGPCDLAETLPAFPVWEAIRSGLRGESVPYMRDLNALTDPRPPRAQASRFAGGVSVPHEDASFRHHYAGF